MKSWEVSSASCCFGSIFPAINGQDAWRSDSQLVRSQVNTTNEIKLHSPIYSTFEKLVVQPAVGHCYREELGLFVDQCQLEVLHLSVLLIDLLSILLRCNDFAYRGLDGWQTTKPWPWPIFWCKFSFGKCFGASELVISGYHIKPTFCCTSQSDWEMACCCTEKEKTLQNEFFYFQSAHRQPLKSSFFTFPNRFKCQMTIEWLTLSSSATSVVLRESASMMAVNWSCQLPMPCHYTPHLQGSRLLCKTSWSITALYIH